jgi:alpha-glucosidase (family GH31 glycosyl hydrolase)
MKPPAHRPLGGHAYRIEPDQRFPAQPMAGQPLQIRALADAAATSVTLELDTGRTLQMQQVSLDDLYSGASSLTDPGDGHLGAASRALPNIGDATTWRVELPPLGSEPFRYRFDATDGTDTASSAWFFAAPASWAPAHDAAGAGVRIVGDESRLITDRTELLISGEGVVRVRFALRLGPGERVVGFGERYNALDQRGGRLDTVVFEQYTEQGRRTYLPSPFAVVAGGSGWGFHLRTSRRAWFDVGATEPDVVTIEVGVDPADPLLELRVYDGAPADVIAAHVAEVGGLALPPQWVFRPWMSANDWNTQAIAEREVDRSFELDVPVGVIVIEAWADEQTFCVFRDAQYEVRPDGAPLTLADITFPANGAWPDPVGMAQRMHDRDVKVVLWQIPLIPTDRGHDGQVGADAATLIERGYCVRDGNGLPYRNRGWWFPGALLPDWTNPDAKAWWLAKRRYLMTEVGIDGFKTDGGEHAWGDDLRYADGTRGDVSNNLSALQYAQAYTDLLHDTGVDGCTFSRAGFTGSGTAPAHWAGDEMSTWEAFRASVLAGLTAGVSGVAFWGFDIAGFSGEVPTAELWLRATAMAALCPIMQYHAEHTGGALPCRDRTPWNLAERTGDERALSVYRQFAKLRDRLVPYLWAQAQQCVDRGLPLMRALCIDHPDDPKVWNVPFQYHLGDEILVAPIVQPGAVAIDVYLPAGTWTDAFTGEVHEGPATVHRETPWHEIAAYLRGPDVAELRRVFTG